MNINHILLDKLDYESYIKTIENSYHNKVDVNVIYTDDSFNTQVITDVMTEYRINNFCFYTYKDFEPKERYGDYIKKGNKLRYDVNSQVIIINLLCAQGQLLMHEVRDKLRPLPIIDNLLNKYIKNKPYVYLILSKRYVDTYKQIIDNHYNDIYKEYEII